MPHFNTHMSYSELIRALSEALAQGCLLSRAEIGCINSSVDEPLMKALIERYPLRTAFKKLLGQSVERERALRPDLDLNVHSAAYGGERDKTALFLRRYFPAQAHIDVIERTKELVQRFIVSNDATFNKQLLQAEKARLKEREREFEAGQLSYVRPEASLEAMQADFIAYTEHLERSKQEGSTYAWETLSSLFHRIDTFAEGTPERADAERLLLSALDSARTAYHVYAKQYDPSGKDYTCPKGLEERLLDGHFFITTAVEPPSESPLSHFLDRLLTPFIKYDTEMKGEGNPPACSELLYALYFEAAGYSTKQEVVERYCFKGQEKKDIVARLRRLSQGDFLIEQKTDSVAMLRQQYLATLNPSKEKTTETEEQRQQREKKDQEKQRGFNAVIGLLPEASCEELDNQYGEIMTFLKSKDAIEQQEITEETVTAPAQPKEHEAIIRAMLESGSFLDANHLQLVLSITGDDDLKTMQEMTKKGKTPESYDERSIPTRGELQRLHATYLGSENGVFCHFYDEPTINQRLTNDQMHHSLSIAEPALCLWLSDHSDALSRLQKERLAVLCAKAGYARAIRVLCSNMPGWHVSANHVDGQEQFSLLQMASAHGHTDTARALLDAGAEVNVQDNDGSTALMWASQNGHTDTARALLDAGADLNFQNSHGRNALIWTSCNGHTDIARALIDAGAEVNLQSWSGSTALMQASENGYIDIARALLDAGADVNLQDRYGWTALMKASIYGHTDIARALLDAGADVNLQRWSESTALILASRNGHTDIACALLDAGAEVNLQDRDGRTALMMASHQGHTDTARALIGAGADRNVKDKYGDTALMKASRCWDSEIIQLLKSATSIQGTPELGSPMVARVKAEEHFIILASNHIAGDIDWNNLNLNHFRTGASSALDIALSHNNVGLVEAVLAQESLAPWVVLKALKEHFDVMLPLVGQHERFRRLLTLRKNDFSEQHQYAIANCFESKQLASEISAGSSLTFSGSHTSGNSQKIWLLSFLSSFIRIGSQLLNRPRIFQ